MLRRVLRSLPLYVDLRRWQREGFSKAVSRYCLWSKILKTHPIVTAPVCADSLVEAHILCCRRDYLTAIWALKSFYHYSKENYPLVIHIQGGLQGHARARLAAHFPNAQILPYDEATTEISRSLVNAKLSRLLAWRNKSPFMMKLVDFNLFAKARVMLALDSDLLFFRQPREILEAVREADQSGTVTFQRDDQSTYNIDAASVKRNWGIILPERINTGVIACQRGGIDLSQCEQWLGDSEIARPTGWIEQTLYAMCAAERVRYLPDTYLVSREKNLDSRQLVMRHYAGDTRQLLTDEGMPFLAVAGFLQSCQD